MYDKQILMSELEKQPRISAPKLTPLLKEATDKIITPQTTLI